jgi:hypothetical protein
MKCYLCGDKIEGPEGAIHPAGGFGWRHLTCDPQEHVQQLPKESAGIEDAYTVDDDGNLVPTGATQGVYEHTEGGDVQLTTYGALITARAAADVARQRAIAAAEKGADS